MTTLGTSTIDMYLGSVKLSGAYLGATKIYSGAKIDSDFNVLGVLYDWFIDFAGDIVAAVTGFGGLVGQLISDGLTGIYNGLGDIVGALGKFVPNIDTSSGNLGIIVSQIPGAIGTAICSGLNAVGGLVKNAASGGLVGFINGLPIIGGAFQWLHDFFTGGDPLGMITSLIGSIPIVQDLGNLLGIVQDATSGALSDPVNFITDGLGNVLGQLTCGLYKPKTGSSTAVTYPIGSIGGMARMLVPDGLVSLTTTTSFARSQDVTDADDGWLQVGVGTSGTAGYSTRVFRRYSNSGAKTNGVGIHLMDGQASIIRRVGSVDTLVAPAAAQYAPGDDLYLDQTGDVHTLYLNGAPKGEWDDSASHTAVKNASNRSVGMAMQASQDLLGPRSFSPSLTYVRAA